MPKRLRDRPGAEGCVAHAGLSTLGSAHRRPTQNAGNCSCRQLRARGRSSWSGHQFGGKPERRADRRRQVWTMWSAKPLRPDAHVKIRSTVPPSPHRPARCATSSAGDCGARSGTVFFSSISVAAIRRCYQSRLASGSTATIRGQDSSSSGKPFGVTETWPVSLLINPSVHNLSTAPESSKSSESIAKRSPRRAEISTPSRNRQPRRHHSIACVAGSSVSSLFTPMCIARNTARKFSGLRWRVVSLHKRRPCAPGPMSRHNPDSANR